MDYGGLKKLLKKSEWQLCVEQSRHSTLYNLVWSNQFSKWSVSGKKNVHESNLIRTVSTDQRYKYFHFLAYLLGDNKIITSRWRGMMLDSFMVPRGEQEQLLDAGHYVSQINPINPWSGFSRGHDLKLNSSELLINFRLSIAHLLNCSNRLMTWLSLQ